MVAAVVEDYNDRLGKNFYINDGARSISHETNFQDYLEKYFGFRKAYCKLHVAYNRRIKLVVKVLFPFRKYYTNSMKLVLSIKLIPFCIWSNYVGARR